MSNITHAKFGLVRTEIIKSQLYCCAVDVCNALGYKNTRDAIRQHCRGAGVVKRDIGVETGLKRDGSPALQQVEMTFIDEGNLYRLILKSNLPAAREFESWVCDEVLPAIRRTGSYSRYTYQKGSNTALGSDYQLLTLRNITKIKSAPLRKHMTEQLDFFIAQLNLPEV